MAKRKQPTKAVASLATRATPAPTSIKAQSPIDLIMSARLARQLGISPVTFWRWRKMEDFPAGRRIRNHVYFSQSAVLAWLDRQQQAA
jgi:predicted DNA-binding transcriptional regulator AlpA